MTSFRLALSRVILLQLSNTYLPIDLLTYQPVKQPTCRSACLSANLPTYLPICLPYKPPTGLLPTCLILYLYYNCKLPVTIFQCRGVKIIQVQLLFLAGLKLSCDMKGTETLLVQSVEEGSMVSRSWCWLQVITSQENTGLAGGGHSYRTVLLLGQI